MLIDQLDLVVRVCAAMLCGAIIGLERSFRTRDAGIRTHCIIAVASALFMIVSTLGFTDMAPEHSADTARIAAQAVSGIGFLGAGAIFKNESTVKGLSTAAGMWFTAGVGICCGSGMKLLAIICTAVIVLTQLMSKSDAEGVNERLIHIEMTNTPQAFELLEQLKKKFGVTTLSTTIERHGDDRLLLAIRTQRSKPIPFDEAASFCKEHDEIIAIVR